MRLDLEPRSVEKWTMRGCSSTRTVALTVTIVLGLFVSNLDFALADVIGGLDFPVRAGPDVGPAAPVGAGEGGYDGLSQDDIDYLLQSIRPGEEMAAAIQASKATFEYQNIDRGPVRSV